MSLLQQLQKRRTALRATTTVVTTPTGARYAVNGGTTKHLEQSNYGFVVDTKPDPIPACILSDFLYLGSQDAVSVENVDTFNLTHILSVGIETPNIDQLPSYVQCRYLPCLDLPETKLVDDVLPPAFDFIATAKASGGRVLVHCNAGVSRSAAIVIAYLMLNLEMDFQTATDFVKSLRASIQPNAGFRQQLMNYNK